VDAKPVLNPRAPQSHERKFPLKTITVGYTFVVEGEDISPVALTCLLKAWNDGDSLALERLTPIVYAELHRLARLNLSREPQCHLLQPSALINEAFVRLIGGAQVEWANRAHFFAVSARLMRQILIDFARSRGAEKRGKGMTQMDVSQVADHAGPRVMPVDFLDLDTALNDLSRLAPRQAQVVELRYFGGLGNLEIASALGTSEPTVVRDWRAARVWLFDRLRPRESR
jgi:RNA polymerase sigma factor (TIGR02999 family)